MRKDRGGDADPLGDRGRDPSPVHATRKARSRLPAPMLVSDMVTSGAA